MYYFCTYFDQNYLPQGLALYNSLSRHSGHFTLFILCFDDVTYKYFIEKNYTNIIPVSLAEFERDDEKLLSAKKNRSLIEYYFTCTPTLPLYILNKYSSIDLITYLDADLFFFADPTPIFEEIKDNPVAIVEHKHSENLKHFAKKSGIYNVGWLSFRRNNEGLSCLNWWRERCIEWCYDRVEGGKFADQKYLDDWPERFPGTAVVVHKGANLAPWNLRNYKISYKQGKIWVDNYGLIFFHFHGFKQLEQSLYDTGISIYNIQLTRVVKKRIYVPYIEALRFANLQAGHLMRQPNKFCNIRYSSPKREQEQQTLLTRQILRKLKKWLHIFKGNYILFTK